ncbi:MAG TPA: sigma-70 family RNA polymerase sigma factor, partial [Acidimicrobiales bacterium]|nr:sigma-70 family RNA polymerase sigma factor [Acidimicrobiales bacterium]
MAIGEAFEPVLAAAQTGAEWGFGRLYAEYNPRLERYFAARTPRMAEDLAADTWLGAARALREFQGDEGRFRSWLFTIAHRRLADHWEDLRRRPADPAGAGPEDDPVAADDTEGAVLDALSAQAAAARIAAALSGDQAEVVLLRLLGDLDVDQVAEVLGKRPGTIRVLQHRA